MNLEGRVAIITGGASGIGAACCRTFAQAGATVIIADSNRELGDQVAADLREGGHTAFFHAIDVTSEEQCAALVDFGQRLGRVDCAVNCAGIAHRPASFEEFSEDEWRTVWDINLMGMSFCMKHEARFMTDQGRGSIVNIASLAGLRGVRDMAPYSAAKFAVVGLTRTAAADLGRRNVRVNAVCPGLIATPMTKSGKPANFDWGSMVRNPLGRIGRPEEVADVALWLASDRSSFVTGETIAVDGGECAT